MFAGFAHAQLNPGAGQLMTPPIKLHDGVN